MRTELSVREDVLSRADKLRLAHAPPPPHPNTTWTLEEKDERGTRQNINQEHRLDPLHSNLLRDTNKVKSLSLISNLIFWSIIYNGPLQCIFNFPSPASVFNCSDWKLPRWRSCQTSANQSQNQLLFIMSILFILSILSLHLEFWADCCLLWKMPRKFIKI